MTRRKTITKRNENIRKMVLDRVPIKTIASRYKIHQNSVRAIITNLVNAGLLMRVPNTSPAIYVDPHARVTITYARPSEIVSDEPIVENNEPPCSTASPRRGCPRASWDTTRLDSSL